MPDSSWDERAGFAAVDWHIPMTEDFVERVHAGLRRRRRRRAVLTSGSVLGAGLLAAASLGMVNGIGAPDPNPPALSPQSARAAPLAAQDPVALDGFVLGYVPEGLRHDAHDSVYTAPVGEAGLGDDRATPVAGEPSVTVTLRRFTAPPAPGSVMWVTVLRPSTHAGSEVETERIQGWLLDWADVADAERVPVAVGEAYLVAPPSGATQGTGSRVVIAAATGEMILVEGSSQALSAGELRRVAEGLTR